MWINTEQKGEDEFKKVIMDRLTKLEEHEYACKENWRLNEEHRKKNNDALNNLAQSNVVFASSIDNLSKVLTEIVPITKRSKDFQSWWDKVCVWYDYNRTVGKWIIGSILTLAAVAAALKQLGVW